MKTNERPIDFFFDFINVVFFLVISALFFVYFIVGDRIFMAKNLLRAIMPFSLYSIFFLYKLRTSRGQMKHSKEKNMEEIVVYLDMSDIRKDRAVVISLPIIMLLLTLIDKAIDAVDIFQASSVFLIIFFWHWFKLRAKAKDISCPGLTRIDILRDDLVVYSLPFVSMIMPVMLIDFGLVDILQSIAPLVVMFIWRKVMFNKI